MIRDIAKIADVFSVFHDGEISGYESDGENLTLRIGILYLAERVNSTFTSFSVRLGGVGPITFRTWPRTSSEAPAVLDRLEQFLGTGLEVLDASVANAGIRIVCNQADTSLSFCGGEISLTATNAVVTDEAGKDYSIDELYELSRAYWDDWSRRGGAS